ncbi:MAG TPA: anthranilate synthase component I family protein [Planctomycetota bacterium]|nr:anthranilate synthase component I family protein [Planctomycetota bacterium]
MINFPAASLTAFVQPLDTHSCGIIQPLTLFSRCAKRADLFWLDSGDAINANAWSYLGYEPAVRVEVYGTKLVTHTASGETFDSSTDALPNFLSRLGRSILRKEKPAGAPPFCGGWLGYLSYDFLRGDVMRRGADMPLAVLSYFPSVLAFSHQEQRWWSCGVFSATDAAQPQSIATDLLTQNGPSILSLELPHSQEIPYGFALSDFEQRQYIVAVERALEYIRAGDIYQVNLAQRFSSVWEKDAAELYLRLRAESLAQYGAYLGSALAGGCHALCSISPELFLSVRGREILTRPIKGTRPRDPAPSPAAAEANARARRELECSEKERAELNMIVDLERNDLGRVCDYGSVRVRSAGEVEELPTLFHRVATIEGRLRDGCSLYDILQATFPGGSVTGAPKIRAMQIIDELERSARGPYCGAIGWISPDGDMDLSIAIRTAVFDGSAKVAHYHAGSGIVADSDPQKEYEETLHKAAAFFRATHTTFHPDV